MTVCHGKEYVKKHTTDDMVAPRVSEDRLNSVGLQRICHGCCDGFVALRSFLPETVIQIIVRQRHDGALETPCLGIIEVERTFDIRVSRLTRQIVGETVSDPRSVGAFVIHQEEKSLTCNGSTALERILIHCPDRNDTARFDIVQAVESGIRHTITGGCTGREAVVEP